MKPFFLSFILVIATAACAQSRQQPASDWPLEPSSFFKITFGQPITASVEQCPPMPQASGVDGPAAISKWMTLFCFDRRVSLISIKHIPGFFSTYVGEVNGNVGWLSTSFAAAARASTAAALVERFGAPTSEADLPWESKSGVQVKTHIMTWSGKDLIVNYLSIGGSIDQGSLSVTNSAYRASQKDVAGESIKAKARSF